MNKGYIIQEDKASDDCLEGKETWRQKEDWVGLKNKEDKQERRTEEEAKGIRTKKGGARADAEDEEQKEETIKSEGTTIARSTGSHSK